MNKLMLVKCMRRITTFFSKTGAIRSQEFDKNVSFNFFHIFFSRNSFSRSFLVMVIFQLQRASGFKKITDD